MINEQQIDEVIDQLSESDDVFEAHLDALQDEQPMLLSYLFSEDNEAFTNEEREYLIFLSVVIWQAFRRSRHTERVPTTEEISEAEERNWELLNGVPAQHFADRISVFFEDYPEEDLLAFIEDALSDDEESPITREGREPMFVTLKTVVDVLM